MVWVPVPQGQTSHVIRDLEYGREYDVKVRAVNQIGPGDPTAAIRLPVVDRSSPAYAVPPQPEGFQCRAGITKVYLTWHNPFAIYANHGRTVVYRHTEDDYANAELVGHSTGISYVDDGGEDGLGGDDPENPPTWYYWILWESIVSVLGPPSEVCAAEMAINPRTAIPAISQQIIDDPFTKELLAPIPEPVLPDLPGPDVRPERLSEVVSQGVAQRLVELELLRQLELLGLIADEVGEDLRAELRLLTMRIEDNKGNITRTAALVAVLQATIPTLATATALQTLEAKVTKNAGDVTANTSLITNLRAELGDYATAAALQVLEAKVNTNTGGLARWLVKLSVDSLVGGVGLLNDGTNVKFYVAADRFAVIPPGTTTGNILPFVVEAGKVYLDTAVIKNASITALMAENAFLEHLTAIHGQLDFARINKGNIFDLIIDGRIRSDNYNGTIGADGRVVTPGTAGFYIGRTGHADFQSILADVRNWTPLWKGSQTLTTTDYDVPGISGADTAPFSHIMIAVSYGLTSDQASFNAMCVFRTGISTRQGFQIGPNSNDGLYADIDAVDISVRTITGRATMRGIWGVNNPLAASGGTSPDRVTTRTDTIRRRGTSAPSTPTGGTTSATFLPTGWTRGPLSATTTQGVYESSRTITETNGVFTSATNFGAPVLVEAATGTGITTNTDTIRIRASSRPSKPTGGTASNTHLPTGWTRGALAATETESVWASSRTRTYRNAAFLSATAWGDVTEEQAATGTAVIPTPTAPFISVRSPLSSLTSVSECPSRDAAIRNLTMEFHYGYDNPPTRGSVTDASSTNTAGEWCWAVSVPDPDKTRILYVRCRFVGGGFGPVASRS